MPQSKHASSLIGTFRVIVLVVLSLVAAGVGLVFLLTSDKDSRIQLKQRFNSILDKAKASLPISQ